MNVRHVAGLAILAAVIGACVIAEPATDLPELPAQPPTIIRSQVVPSPNVVLTKWPDRFIVPVRLTDPSLRFFYSAFVDYNPANGEGLVVRDESTLDINATAANPRLLEIPIEERPGDRCQVVEVVVALDLRDPHTPSPSGGDIVSWFYSPGGDLAGCPGLETGLRPDAEALLSKEAGN